MGIFGAKFIQSILNGWGYFFKERMMNEVEVLIETMIREGEKIKFGEKQTVASTSSLRASLRKALPS